MRMANTATIGAFLTGPAGKAKKPAPKKVSHGRFDRTINGGGAKGGWGRGPARLDQSARWRRRIGAHQCRGRLEYRAWNDRAPGAGRRHWAGAAVRKYP